MKLADVFASQEAWRRLSQVRLPAARAYELFKYLKLVTAEYEILEQRRVAVLRRISGAAEGMPVSLEAGTPAHDQFIMEFGAFLDADSDLQPLAMSFDKLMELLSADSNLLSVAEMALIEPFCQTEEQT
jgi:hypothetical protein